MITRVKDVEVGNLVTFDGQVCKVTGFRSRNTVFIKNLDPSGSWSDGKVALRDVKRQAFLEDLAKEGGLRSVVAQALQDGLREKGVICKVDSINDELRVAVSAHRPDPYVKLKFTVLGNEEVKP
jgi:hypothetical protein